MGGVDRGGPTQNPKCFTKKEYTNNYEYQREGKAYVDNGEGSRKKAKIHNEKEEEDEKKEKKTEQQEEDEFAC